VNRLLANAEASLSAGAGIDLAIRNVGKGLEYFRTEYRGVTEEPAERVPAVEARRSALVALATVLVEMDESVLRRDPESIRVALDKAREALDICRFLDESAHPSGVRRRFPTRLAK
jgi:hypothetical protein